MNERETVRVRGMQRAVPNQRTLAVVGIGFAPKKNSKQVLHEDMLSTSSDIKAGPLDISVDIDKTRQDNVAVGQELNRHIDTILGGYAVSIEITVTRLPILQIDT